MNQLRIAIAVNDETPKVFSANTGNWSIDSIRAASINQTTHTVSAPGKQTLKVWAVDPTAVVDKFTITTAARMTTTTSFEVENLATAGKTANITYRTFDETASSGGRSTVLESTTNGQFVALTLPYVRAGSYDLSLRAKKLPLGASCRFPWRIVQTGHSPTSGSTVDLYSGSEAYANTAAAPRDIRHERHKIYSIHRNGKKRFGEQLMDLPRFACAQHREPRQRTSHNEPMAAEFLRHDRELRSHRG